MRRNKISGRVGVVLGGLMLLSQLSARSSSVPGGAAYEAGRSAGLIFGIVMLVAGLYYLKRAKQESGD